MLLFVGLGNPNPGSQNNRHNIGFKIIDHVILPILNKYDIESEIWSFTSFNLLRKNGMEIERIYQLDPLNT